MKKIILTILAAAALISTGFLAFAGGDESSGQVIAYYFHGSFRCRSCRFIEANTESALKEYFVDELKSGELVFKQVNVEEKENQHLTDDYQLYTKSVILSLVKDGKEAKWKNLDKVWHLLRDKNKFYNYIKSETQGFLDNLREAGGS